MEPYSQPFDICIVCALAEEAKAVVQEFSDRCENLQFQQAFSRKNGYAYQHATLRDQKGELLALLITCLPFPGPIETALRVKSLLEEFHPRFVAMTGICAGYKEKVALGDLVAASYAFHADEGKVEAGQESQDTLQPEWRTYSPLSSIIQNLQTFISWESPLIEMKQRFLRRKLQPTERPRCFIAPIASGMAVQGNNPFPQLLVHNRKAMFFDQEVAAFYHTLHEHRDVSFLAVKGVCDYADTTKNDDYHEYAARVSAIYLLLFIQEYVTDEAMPKRYGFLWNVPYPRNPFFTGRKPLLQQLAEALRTDQATAFSQVQAISGLGGIGKTQMAVEYAYLHRREYQAVLWVLADTRESLISGYLAIARLLSLPERHAESQYVIIQAIKTWLQTHGSSLLILDNVDDLSLAYEFLPPMFGGHLLITTRAQATGTRAHRIEVDALSQDVGALFLLHRAKLVALDVGLTEVDPSDLFAAREICNELGGLPLALDQAGAFIEEVQCSLQDYQKRYRTHQTLFLKRRGGIVSDHPEPVATTWSLSFEKVEQRSPLAADLLRMLALLHPDAIPAELLAQGTRYPDPASVTKDDMVLEEALAILGTYSLVHRNRSEKTLSIHRLVQAVLRDTMDQPTRHMQAERTVQAVNSVFPDVEFTTWPLCERYLPHALMCRELAEQEQITTLEAARLFYHTGCYLLERARVSEAYPLLQQALVIREQQLGPEHPETANIVDRLARCFRIQGKYTESESFYRRALAIREKQLGVNHPDTAASLNNLALLSKTEGKYEQAGLLYIRALNIREQQLGPEHHATAQSLNDLASLYWNQGNHKQAELLFQRALSIREQQLGPKHPDTAQSVWWLASISMKQWHEYDKAEPLYQRALSIYEQALGPEHPHTQKVRRGYVSLLKLRERDEKV